MGKKIKKMTFYNSTLLNEISVIVLADIDRYQFVGERLDLTYENINKTTLIYGQPT